MQYSEIISEIKSNRNPGAVAGMTRFGINPRNTYGVSIPILRSIAKRAGKSHALALKLWDSGIHEARIVASVVDEPEKVTEAQMDKWAAEFDSWDVCDQVCMNLFRYTRYAWKKAVGWAKEDSEFVRRAGFVMMAQLAVSEKNSADLEFEKFFPLIEKGSSDSRNFVRKAVNWALRQIGKRNLWLNTAALEEAKKIAGMDSKSARWVANDAIKELSSRAVLQRLRQADGKSHLLKHKHPPEGL